MACLIKKTLQNGGVSGATFTGTAVSLETGDVRFFAVLKVTANLSTTFTAKIQHSHNNSDFVDVTGGGFTNVTGATSDQSIVLPDAMMGYVRVIGTLTGGTTTATVVCTLCHDRANPR